MFAWQYANIPKLMHNHTQGRNAVRVEFGRLHRTSRAWYLPLRGVSICRDESGSLTSDSK